MKERILIPERLRARIERLVQARMRAAHEDEILARRTVEHSVVKAGVEALERQHDAVEDFG